MGRGFITGMWVVLFASAARGQWVEQFDTYSTGPLSTQSPWEQWDGQSKVDAEVDNGRRFTLPHSCLIRGDVGPDPGDDVVYDFANLPGGRPTRGSWVFSIRTQVTAGSSGDGFVILLNEYPSPKNWSLEVRFDADLGEVRNENGPEKLALRFGEWTSLVVCVDLDADRMDVFYGDKILIRDESWKDGVSGGGSQQMAVLNLFAGQPGYGTTGMRFDDVHLEEAFGPCNHLHVRPNPIYSGDTLDLLVECPTLPSRTRAALFTWSVNAVPFRMRLISFRLNASGRWSTSFSAPAGLSGLHVGLRALALPTAGPVSLSNEELFVFR